MGAIAFSVKGNNLDYIKIQFRESDERYIGCASMDQVLRAAPSIHILNERHLIQKKVD